MATPPAGQAEELFERLADLALWVTTEVRRADEFEFIAQRHRSRTVHDWWLSLAQLQVKARRKYLVGEDGRNAVRHEHVVPRESLKQSLRAARSVDDMRRVPSCAEACVVTKQEAPSLPDGTGWERYAGARIDVWDRNEQRWLDFSCP